MVSRTRKAAAQASYQQGERKNFVYNGDINVAQRGATVACGAGANAYGPDRWQAYMAATNGYISNVQLSAEL